MSTPLRSTPRSPYVGQITVAGQTFNVRVDPTTKRRFVGNYELDAFIEKMNLQRRTDILGDLAEVGWAELRGKHVFDSPKYTAWEVHQARRRRN